MFAAQMIILLAVIGAGTAVLCIGDLLGRVGLYRLADRLLERWGVEPR